MTKNLREAALAYHLVGTSRQTLPRGSIRFRHGTLCRPQGFSISRNSPIVVSNFGAAKRRSASLSGRSCYDPR